MNTRENTPRRAAGRPRRLTAALVVALFSAITFALALATGAGKGETTGADARVQAQTSGTRKPSGPAVRRRPGHSDYLVGLTRRAMGEGFGKDAVVLLQAGRGPGRAAVATQLRRLADGKRFGERLTSRDLKPSQTDDRNAAFVGPSASLKVFGDGTKFRFHANLDEEYKRAGNAGRMIEKEEVEKLGRRFVGDALGEFVKLGREESLVFLGARYLREEGISADEKEKYESVVATIAVFGREVSGVPVIGSGSKVAVWFAGDRQPVGFDVDWPVYTPQRTRQAVLPRERLFERVRSTTVAPQASGRAAVERFECGYVDLGASSRGGSLLQAGCAIHYSGRGDDGLLRARVEFVPAGVDVVPDPKWALSRLIASGRTISTDSPEFTRYASALKAPDRPPARRVVPRKTETLPPNR